MTFSAREAAWEILERFERRTPGRRHQTLKLDACLERVFSSAKSASWRSEDRRFCTALTYGVLRRWLPYEARLQALSQFPWSRVAPPVRALLRLGLFQLLDGDEIPPYAALNETVEQARRRGLSKASIAFVNGMLRAVQRQQAAGDWIPPSFEAEPSAHLAQVWNVPEWLGARWLLHYGKSETLAMARMLADPPPLSLRVNTLQTSPKDLKTLLMSAGVTCAVLEDDPPECLTLSGFYGSPVALPGFAEGAFFVQDRNAARVSRFLAPEPGETVVDLCAAPGGKTTHLAALMANRGVLWAVESVAAKMARLQENATRLGVTILQTACEDALTFSLPDGGRADRVLIDAPCSGLGTIRRHPDILLQLTERDLAQYADKQRALLVHGLSLLRAGGEAVYATCSLDVTENGDVARAVLKDCPNVCLLEERQWPISSMGDGFYMARFRLEQVQ